MNEKRSTRMQLYIIVAILVIVGVWRMYYKIGTLGFPLLPGQQAPVWLIEARITFDATGGPVKVSFNVPDQSPGFRIYEEHAASAGYGYSMEDVGGDRRAVWAGRNLEGPQVIFYRVQVYDAVGSAGVEVAEPPPVPEVPVWESDLKVAAETVVKRAKENSADAETFAGELMRRLNRESPSEEAKLLLQAADLYADRTELFTRLLAMEGITSRVVRGVYLQDVQRRQPMVQLLEIYTGREWLMLDIKTGKKGMPANFVLWQRGGQSLLDVEGGSNSKVTMSVIKNIRPVRELITARAMEMKSRFVDLSIYALPIEEQNVIKKLLVIPLGTLIVVLIRNIVGLKTSGTFMPILIAIALLETKLLPGLLILSLIVGVGLLIRMYLSRLNLLLVPRISTIVVIVIFLMVTMSVLSFKLGIHQGLAVTFFPMIILAWTIERLSITSEEEGVGEALKQLGGSLVVATIVCLLMSSRVISHLMYAFPEVNLFILGAVMLLGAYTGYRLLELRRFEPLVKEK